MTSVLAVKEATEELSTYAYSYPHKSSYRPLSPPVPIKQIWRDEDVSRLSLYIHIPFCEMRCGFCNLFTQSQPGENVVKNYLDVLLRQMSVVRDAVPAATFHQLAIGGGTPTFLAAEQLEALFGTVETVFGQRIAQLPTSIETSPSTATEDRLGVLAEFGVHRVSLGVQSFSPEETRLFGRPQDPEGVHRAVRAIRQNGDFELNLDLIYGHPEQTRASWQFSLRQALAYRPEELYLYPLYVRKETGLAKHGLSAVGHRIDLYREARDLLADEGYEQVSLRCFRLSHAEGPVAYACQRDGMIGLGCGARSYTQRLHYATRYAVTQAGIQLILRDWIAQDEDDLALATHGMWLDQDEQLRRYLILSLLQADGMSRREFAERFPETDPIDLPGISQLVSRGWLSYANNRLKLTSIGLEHSDEVGPLLYSEQVRERLREFTARTVEEILR